MDREPKAHAYDVVGDVHGCFEELCLLLEQLGYERDGERVDLYFGRRRFSVQRSGNRPAERLLFASRQRPR